MSPQLLSHSRVTPVLSLISENKTVEYLRTKRPFRPDLIVVLTGGKRASVPTCRPSRAVEPAQPGDRCLWVLHTCTAPPGNLGQEAQEQGPLTPRGGEGLPPCPCREGKSCFLRQTPLPTLGWKWPWHRCRWALCGQEAPVPLLSQLPFLAKSQQPQKHWLVACCSPWNFTK